MILNEAVTNSIKYAFTGGRFGTISILLEHQDDENCKLTIADNGKGLPADFDEDTLNSLGMNLMKGLSEQLDGKFIMQNNNGLTIEITFAVTHVIAINSRDEFEAA